MSAAQTAVVTGGGAGLGEAIARRLHEHGYRVAIADVDGYAADAVAGQLDRSGHTAKGYGVDVRGRAALEDLLSRVLADFGGAHVLVNNAARTRATPLLEITAEELDDVLAVNVAGTFQACQIFGAHFAEQGYGRIVNMASLAGQNGGTATGGHYASSKGAILSATKVFARELAPRGVTVNAVSPGPQDSPMVRSIVGEENLESFASAIPVGRLGDPAFIGDTVALLASPGAASVTGACWDVNGGLYLR
ncbi:MULTISPECIES: SDR family NAD(P)-dependent oxidoreductase [Prauserella salsuginis group]|uniref:3-oxoacyl-[acyl-carrier protein] reductase n=2 Tax=Prauserella salsuginis group TaxID=2893672 RepID=A0A839XW23_9PSEU|nr:MULTISPECIES: SDR family NAD(P)-dependent oxidoreductase [Prauserella salsuginis group]MBB3664713.1 3-oxoacyl-[acyl-carrier protein] reductase [Prauserella sediminis]MCR3722179.1 3-oxoacyl-[acyl-carrier protein] reductase [Prauserella flava]MCR3736177.1 3-oxoacyl-[acyl-carrier protein] reductase [Prauserella salsuginis]